MKQIRVICAHSPSVGQVITVNVVDRLQIDDDVASRFDLPGGLLSASATMHHHSVAVSGHSEGRGIYYVPPWLQQLGTVRHHRRQSTPAPAFGSVRRSQSGTRSSSLGSHRASSRWLYWSSGKSNFGGVDIQIPAIYTVPVTVIWWQPIDDVSSVGLLFPRVRH